MEKLTILEQFADPDLIGKMEMADKLKGSLMVTLLGMGITFVVLMLLWFLIAMMTKALNRPAKVVAPAAPVAASAAPAASVAPVVAHDDTELVAVITAAIASATNVPVCSVVVQNIRRTGGKSWSNINKQEQLDSRRF